jgi:hypothetical protein
MRDFDAGPAHCRRDAWRHRFRPPEACGDRQMLHQYFLL